MTETASAPPATDIDAGAVRAEVESFCDEKWDPALEVGQWWRLLAGAGYSHPMLPVPAGGRGYGQDQAALVSLVLAERAVLGPPGGLGRMLAAPTIAIHGTPEQIERFVPEILDGRVGWCQLFSEPNAGSDLASLQCRAERDGDEWVISGQKVWTSGGQVADKGMLLARTDPDLPKHGGISWFAFDMDQPQVEVRPLTEMTGRALFNEVFIDEARVADSALIGGLNNGWRVGNTTLMVERASLGSSGRKPPELIPGPKGGVLTRRVGDFVTRSMDDFDGVPSLGIDLWWWLVDLARKNGTVVSRVLRDDLMRLYTLIEINRLSIQRAKAGGRARAARERSEQGAGDRGRAQHRQAHHERAEPVVPRHRPAGRRRRRDADGRLRQPERRPPRRAGAVLARTLHLRRHRPGAAQHHRRAGARAAQGAGPAPRHSFQRSSQELGPDPPKGATGRSSPYHQQEHQ